MYTLILQFLLTEAVSNGAERVNESYNDNNEDTSGTDYYTGNLISGFSEFFGAMGKTAQDLGTKLGKQAAGMANFLSNFLSGIGAYQEFKSALYNIQNNRPYDAYVDFLQAGESFLGKLGWGASFATDVMLDQLTPEQRDALNNMEPKGVNRPGFGPGMCMF